MLTNNQVYLGAFEEWASQIDDESIDLVFTDPPYPKMYFSTYEALANLCPRMMKRGASLMTIAAHFSLENIMDVFRGKLKYRWVMCMNQFEGTHPRMAMGIEVMWKPMLWYVKDAYPTGRGFLRDGIEIIGKDGQLKTHGHKWEQDISWAMYYIEKLTKPGDLVLDPFMGSGTVAEACIRLKRNWIGFEIDPVFFQGCKDRIAGVSLEVISGERQSNIVG